jgi:aminopeptidase N
MIIEDTTYEKNVYVTLDNAKYRASLVDNVNYDVTLALPKGENFYGHFEASFDLVTKPNKTLFLDFRGLKISGLKVNGVDVNN